MHLRVVVDVIVCGLFCFDVVSLFVCCWSCYVRRCFGPVESTLPTFPIALFVDAISLDATLRHTILTIIVAAHGLSFLETIKLCRCSKPPVLTAMTQLCSSQFWHKGHAAIQRVNDSPLAVLHCLNSVTCSRQKLC